MSSVSKAAPDDVRPAVPRVPWNPWLGVLFVVVIFLTVQIMSGLIVSFYPLLRHWSHSQALDWLNNSTTAQFFFTVLAEGGLIGAVYLFLKQYGLKLSSIGLKRPRWRDPFYGLAALPAYYLLYVLSVGLVSHFAPSLNVNQQQQIGFNDVQGTLQQTLTFISLVVLPPLAEEITVRGFLYSSLKKGLPLVWAALGTSALFAAAHLDEGGASGPLYIAAIDTFVLSLVLIYLREKTGSLWASITLHACKNGVAFAALFASHLK